MEYICTLSVYRTTHECVALPLLQRVVYCRGKSQLKSVIRKRSIWLLMSRAVAMHATPPQPSRPFRNTMQISKSGSPGIIALNIDDLLPGDHILTSQSPKVALDILSTATKRFFEKNHNAFDKLRAKSGLDVLLISASTISDITATSTRLNMTTSFNFYPFRSEGLGYDRSFELIRKLSSNGLAGVSPYRVFSHR